MKMLYYLLGLGLLLASCSEPTDRMEISYVNMDIDTDSSVDCDEFEYAFGSMIKTINISDQEIIEIVWEHIQKLVLANTIHESPDTRLKMKIWKGNTLHTICIDRSFVLFNGKMFVYNNEFRHAIEEIIEKDTSSLGAAPSTTNRMEISYLSMDIDTEYPVDCDEFEDYFGNTVNTVSIEDQETIEIVWEHIQKLVLANTTHDSPDTRLKMRIWNGDTLHTICIDRSFVLFNGKMYVYNNEFRREIEKTIENNTILRSLLL